MPDQVNRAEVEDVLSSIRRLVSSDVRPKQVAAGTGPETAPGRLVLTPALRVQDDDATTWAETHPEEDEADVFVDAPEAQETSDTTDEAREDTAAHEAEDLRVDAQEHDRDAGYTAQVGGSSSSSYFFLNHLRKDARKAAADHESEQEERRDEGEAVEEAEAKFEVAEEAAAEHEAAEQAAAEYEAAEDDAVQNAEYGFRDEDTQSGQPEDLSELHAPESEETPDPGPEAAPESLFDKTEDIAPNAPLVFRRATTKELTEKIAALEEVIAKTPDQWEPDDTGKDDYSGTEVEAMEWEDHDELIAPDTAQADSAQTVHDMDAELSGTDEATGAPQDPEAERAEDVFVAQPQFRHRSEPIDYDHVDDGEAVLDEDSLRELVSDIVRQELQGRLGERITRNVRKLVRREIQRALAELDLD